MFSFFFPLSISLVEALECFQSPENPIRFDSIVLSGRDIRGSTKCFLDSVYTDYYLSVRINKLELQGDCPSFSISEYSTLRINEIPESENFPSIQIYQPGDDNQLVSGLYFYLSSIHFRVLCLSMYVLL